MPLTLRQSVDPEEALFQIEEQLRNSGMSPLSQDEIRDLLARATQQQPHLSNPMLTQHTPMTFGQGPELQAPGGGGMFQQTPMQPQQQGQQGQFETTFTLGPDQQLRRMIINRIKNRVREV